MLLTAMGTIRLVAGGMGTASAGITLSGTLCFMLPMSAALAPSREAPCLLPESAARPADVLLPNWCCGHPAALDIRVISPLQQQIVAEAAFTPGHALKIGSQRKLVANLSTCRTLGLECVPMIVEVLGGLASDFITTVSAIGHAIDLRAGSSSDSSDSASHLFQRVCIALWCSNATLWFHCNPTLSPRVGMACCNFTVSFFSFCCFLRPLVVKKFSPSV